MGATRILIRFLRSIFHGTGNSARICQNFGIISGGGLNPPSGYASGQECMCKKGISVTFLGFFVFGRSDLKGPCLHMAVDKYVQGLGIF
jgi:hypothetical protein